MFIINDTNLKFAWESDELIEKMKLETAYAYNFSDNVKTSSEKYVFTDDETPFFEGNIVNTMTDIVDIFQKFIPVDYNSFYIDEEGDEEWASSSNLSGFSTKTNEFDDDNYNFIRLNIIDEKAREYIIKSLMVQWYKTTENLVNYKQASDDRASAYVSLFCSLKYLKENGAYSPNNIKLL